MGPALQIRSGQIVAGFASVAGNSEVNSFHHHNGVFPAATSGNIEKCPHASKAAAAARMADDLARAKKIKTEKAASHASTSKAAAGCPFHAEQETVGKKASPIKGFDYEAFYTSELEKKHQDSSYRYFNNINRLANKFPIAHTGNPKDEVEVWCANDYLGMGNNPIVLETMQYVLITVLHVVYCLQTVSIVFPVAL